MCPYFPSTTFLLRVTSLSTTLSSTCCPLTPYFPPHTFLFTCLFSLLFLGHYYYSIVFFYIFLTFPNSFLDLLSSFPPPLPPIRPTLLLSRKCLPAPLLLLPYSPSLESPHSLSFTNVSHSPYFPLHLPYIPFSLLIYLPSLL